MVEIIREGPYLTPQSRPNPRDRFKGFVPPEGYRFEPQEKSTNSKLQEIYGSSSRNVPVEKQSRNPLVSDHPTTQIQELFRSRGTRK